MTEEKMKSRAMEEKRLHYMVAWRDRYIQRLEERLGGREEENAMLQTLLFYALITVGERQEDGSVTVPVSKQTVSDMLGRWQCDTVDAGEAYLVTFTPVAEAGETRGDKASAE